VDHSSINRWAVRFLPLVEKMARKHKRSVGASWCMDENPRIDLYSFLCSESLAPLQVRQENSSEFNV